MGDIDNLKWTLERQISWVSSADSKLTILGPVPLAMLTVSWSNSSLLTYQFEWTDVLVLASSILLGMSLFFTKAALTPRLGGSLESRIFFGKIAATNYEEFSRDMKSQSEHDFREDLIKQIHRNASIADIKHRNISKSIFWLVLATPIWLASVSTGA